MPYLSGTGIADYDKSGKLFCHKKKIYISHYAFPYTIINKKLHSLCLLLILLSMYGGLLTEHKNLRPNYSQRSIHVEFSFRAIPFKTEWRDGMQGAYNYL